VNSRSRPVMRSAPFRPSRMAYTDDKTAVMDAVKADSKRLSATELMDGEAPAKRKSKIRRLINTQKIQRAYAAVRERMASWVPPARRREMTLGA
jgi:hypothetical protein